MSRRLVVVLFLDMVGWTRLAERIDPEPLQQLLEEYYGICVSSVEENGGVIEKFIGDAVMAVFGAESSQEDDAERALRTAIQIRARVAELPAPSSGAEAPAIHCGVAAGEALVTRSPNAGLRVVGDVVNLAARLQSAAGSGEIIVNEVTTQLARSTFELAAIAPLNLKNKSDPVPAWRVEGHGATPNGKRQPMQLVNRKAERAYLQAAYDSVVAASASRLVAVLGLPGIGKSRLVREVVGGFGTGPVNPVIAYGDCRSYGANGTYEPLMQVVRTLLAESGALAVDAPRHLVEVLSRIDAPTISRAGDGEATPGVEEIAWAAGELLSLSSTRPLVLVWEDLQWAGRSLLELIGWLSEAVRDHPVLIICVARPEFDEQASHLLGDHELQGKLRLGPLSPPEIQEILTSLTTAHAGAEVSAHAADTVERVVTYSSGNPLFAELMVEATGSGYQLGGIPPTIAALVGAMVDRLTAPSRELLEAASVVGATFGLEQVSSLGVTVNRDSVNALVERQLIEPSQGERYRFAQQPVHEVVYGRLEKRQRQAWHRHLAELGENPAFHLECAVRLLAELRPDDADLPELSARAASALLSEGTGALRQRDLPAAVDLLEKARRIAPRDGGQTRSIAVLRLSDALLLSGELQRAIEVAGGADDEPAERSAIACQVQREMLAVRAGVVSDAPMAEFAAQLTLDPTDHLGWCRFEQLRMLLELAAGRFSVAEHAARVALEHAHAMDDAYEEERLLIALCEIGQWSPTPIDEKLASCSDTAVRFAGDRYLSMPVWVVMARYQALLGDLEAATKLLSDAQAAADQLRLTVGTMLVDQVAGMVCSLGDEHKRAEEHFKRAARALAAAGARPTALTMRAQAVRERIHYTEVAESATEIRYLATEFDGMDLRGKVLCLTLRAWLAAATDQAPARVVDEAVRHLDRTDDENLRGDVCFELAKACRSSDDHQRARELADAALASYAAIRATLPMRRVRSWI